MEANAMRLVSASGILALVAMPLVADQPARHDLAKIEQAAHEMFPDLPRVRFVGDVQAECGADRGVNPHAAYCTSANVIFASPTPRGDFSGAYELAHLYGHAVQVGHGVADVALAQIRARRDEEAKLRGWVTRQVECIAGVIFAAAGFPETDLRDLYDAEPLTGSHWGRNPLRVGPKVSIGLDARAEWFATGQKGDLAACAVGEFGAELLLEARR
jgi:hypothetical protein